jgi:hypothetical protein
MRHSKNANLKTQEELDQEVISIAEMALQEQKYQAVVVHMVTGSKTGYLTPSVAVLKDLSARFGNKLIPVVDACQGRMKENGLRNLVEQGFIVLTTGSKFYGGPPFSGAVFLPTTHYSKELQASPVLTPELLGDFHLFFGDLHISDNLPRLKDAVRASAKDVAVHNRGMLVRWAVALNEMEKFHRIPVQRREEIMTLWLKKVRTLVDEEIKSPLISVQPLEREDNNEAGKACMFDFNSIVSLKCKVRQQDSDGRDTYERLGLAELKHLHMLMSRDLSSSLEADPSTQKLLEQKCFIAQPVQLDTSNKKGLTIIRVACGAPMVSWMHEQESTMGPTSEKTLEKAVSMALESDRALFEKMEIVLDNWEALKHVK